MVTAGQLICHIETNFTPSASLQHINTSYTTGSVTSIMSNSSCNYVSESACLSVCLHSSISLCVCPPVPGYSVFVHSRHIIPSCCLLACLSVSQTWQINFVCGITQTNSDELEIASADPPSLSASCTHSPQLLAGNQTQFYVEFMTLDSAWCGLAKLHRHTKTNTQGKFTFFLVSEMNRIQKGVKTIFSLRFFTAAVLFPRCLLWWAGFNQTKKTCSWMKNLLSFSETCIDLCREKTNSARLCMCRYVVL